MNVVTRFGANSPCPCAEAGPGFTPIQCFDRTITFDGLKRLLGAADFSKAGDRNAGLAVALGETEPPRRRAGAILSGPRRSSTSTIIR